MYLRVKGEICKALDLPNQIFSCDDTCGDSIAQSMELDLLVALEVLLTQKDIEVGGLLN